MRALGPIAEKGVLETTSCSVGQESITYLLLSIIV